MAKYRVEVEYTALCKLTIIAATEDEAEQNAAGIVNRFGNAEDIRITDIREDKHERRSSILEGHHSPT